ncbi:hypothetical protein D3C71_1653550 [compost metagenome]
MNPVQERHQVAQPFAQLAPTTLAQDGAGIRVDKYLVQDRYRHTVFAQPHRKRHTAPGLHTERCGGHHGLWHKTGHALAQHQRIQQFGLAGWRRHPMQ